MSDREVNVSWLLAQQITYCVPEWVLWTSFFMLQVFLWRRYRSGLHSLSWPLFHFVAIIDYKLRFLCILNSCQWQIISQLEIMTYILDFKSAYVPSIWIAGSNFKTDHFNSVPFLNIHNNPFLVKNKARFFFVCIPFFDNQHHI